MKRNVRLYIDDIVSSIDAIERFIDNLAFDDFIKDDKTSSAVVRKIEIIGEAAKNIPKEVQNLQVEIPWKDITGMRDVVAHFYFGIDYQIVWETCKKSLPGLKKKILQLIERMNGHE